MGKWYENAVFYHMYPIGMTGAPRRNESEETVHRFQDLMKWLPHIKDLGCTAIYIGPLFESTSHGYDTKDYRMVDRRLGDNQDFKGFVEKAHEMDIRVVVDGVFNHTGREFFAFQDIQKTENSLSTAVGTRESILGGIRLIMMDLAMRHGETVLNW